MRKYRRSMSALRTIIAANLRLKNPLGLEVLSIVRHGRHGGLTGYTRARDLRNFFCLLAVFLSLVHFPSSSHDDESPQESRNSCLSQPLTAARAADERRVYIRIGRREDGVFRLRTRIGSINSCVGGARTRGADKTGGDDGETERKKCLQNGVTFYFVGPTKNGPSVSYILMRLAGKTALPKEKKTAGVFDISYLMRQRFFVRLIARF